MTELDRLMKYRTLLSARRAVSRESLLQALEISPATFKRDLAKLRERVGLPVIFDRDRGGYLLEQDDPHTELPGLWFSQEEILALLTIHNMINQLEPGLLSPKLNPLQERLAEIVASQGTDANVLTRRVKLVHAGKRDLPLKSFQTVAMATLHRRRLNIHHYNRQSGDTIERAISPQQLVYYRDNWYVDAWCHLRDGLRQFSVDAITQCEMLDLAAREVPLSEIEAEVQKGYGIFSGKDVQWADLRFTPERTRWVEREQWHPEQEAKMEKDGSYRLKVPYSDERELIGEIMRHGPEVEVLGPQSLRTHVQRALRAAMQQYESYR
ncbi:MAG: WYL domain-containing protein [Alphaproteobacteria bacterium]|nr:WYL domain-containing protein [Alphaproteobacteria bacterium]